MNAKGHTHTPTNTYKKKEKNNNKQFKWLGLHTRNYTDRFSEHGHNTRPEIYRRHSHLSHSIYMIASVF